MKTIEGLKVYLSSFLTSTLQELGGQLHVPDAMYPMKALPVFVRQDTG
jgi:hypothetical protein